MAANLPTIDLSDLTDVEGLPRKVRTSEPTKSPYQPLIQRSLDEGGTDNGRSAGEGKPKALPGKHSLVPDGDSKTSAFTAITRELGRAARQMGLRVKTRKIVDKDNADLVVIVYQTFREDNGSTDAPVKPAEKVAEKPAENGTAAQVKRPATATTPQRVAAR